MVPVGFVACKSTTGRVKLHLMREDQSKTVCGRYSIDRILPEDQSGVNEQTSRCEVCLYAADQSTETRLKRRKAAREYR